MQVQALLTVPLLASAAAAAVTPVVQLAQAPSVAVQAPASAPASAPTTTVAPVPVVQTAPTPAAAYTSSPAATGISYWYSLRQNDRQAFSTYYIYLTRYRGWPGETGFRKSAERAIDDLTSPRDVVNFFRVLPPLTATGHAKYAFALYSSGQADLARSEAREAWRGGALARPDEDRLLSLFSSALTPSDHDARLDVLLDLRDAQSAYRLLYLASPARRPIYETRIALQSMATDSPARVQSLGALATSDPGLLMDRARYLRDTGQPAAARQLLATPYTFSSTRADTEEWLEALLSHARGAASDRQWTLAYQIASQADKAFPAGTDISARTNGERDDYTSLVWLGGIAAYRGLNRPSDAMGMFVRYARAGRSTQVTSKGYYWAGRAAQAAGQTALATEYFTAASAHPELFYGQLSLERLGRAVPAPVAAASMGTPTPAERKSFFARDLTEATRLLGQWGRWQDQSSFIRTLTDQAKTPGERVLVAEFSRQISRPDMAVWLARNARNAGSPFYARETYPQMRIPQSQARYWSLAHGIMRQESSFDRGAVSPAGARGMMQLMPATARQTAGKMDQDYSLGRLTSDPDYNIMLGSAYFAELMRYWNGSAPLAVASYNAGMGNVRKWVANNGDPRTRSVDIVSWIEDIPFTETRGYVQRVLENTVVYDTLYPSRANFQSPPHVSVYLGKSNSPG